MHYYGYIDSQNICQGTYGFPSLIEDPSYIYLGTEDDKSVIGKKWDADAQEWVEVVHYYYAQLNSKDICTGVQEYPSAINSPSLIRIDTLDESLKGKWYDRTDGTFKVAPFHIVADHSTDFINYRETDECLSDVLDAKADAEAVYTKVQADAKFALKGEGGTGGANGLSAYEVAVANGFEGTETEWLESLHGAAGQNGEDGTIVKVGTTTTAKADTPASVQGVMDGNTLTLNFTVPKGADGKDGADGTDADVTATDILTKLKTVDGQNSGLDADMLDGHDSTYFATATQLTGKADAEHTHDGYAPANHTHTEYAEAMHGHDGVYAPMIHNHAEYAPVSHVHGKNEIDGLTTALNNKADANHSHSGYSASGHTHSLSSLGAAASGHNHSEYSLSGHNHTSFASSITFNGDAIRTCNIYPNAAGTYNIGGYSNRYKFIYSDNQLQVGSDERIKHAIELADETELANFIEQVKVKNFIYNNDESNKKRLGVIAQDLVSINDKVAGYFVNEDVQTGFLGLGVADLVFPLIAAVQRLSREVAALKSK